MLEPLLMKTQARKMN